MARSISSRRLAKELNELRQSDGLVGIKLLKADDFQTWLLSIEVMGESLYKGEVFALQFTFEPEYPIASPEVVFVVDTAYQPPIHPHIYSNGHICASILGHEWSPVLSVASVCLTLQSMLASCKVRIFHLTVLQCPSCQIKLMHKTNQKKERPVDNDRYIKTAPKSPKKTRFHYDDDT